MADFVDTVSLFGIIQVKMHIHDDMNCVNEIKEVEKKKRTACVVSEMLIKKLIRFT